MGTKQNPGPYDCYAKALPDEPIFILLGRDDCANSAVLHWANLREHQIIEGIRPSADRAMVAEARRWAADAHAWRNDNWPGRKGEPVRNERQELIDVVGRQTERAERAEAEVTRLTALLHRSHEAIADELIGLIDSFLVPGQSQMDVLNDLTHDESENSAYERMNALNALIGDIVAVTHPDNAGADDNQARPFGNHEADGV
jgi:hypothetical protein